MVRQDVDNPRTDGREVARSHPKEDHTGMFMAVFNHQFAKITITRDLNARFGLSDGKYLPIFSSLAKVTSD
jgi:hypothetical protein